MGYRIWVNVTPTTNYYTYNVTSTYECISNSCSSITNESLIACLTTLTTGQYVLDCSSGKVFYVDSYYGYGAYGGFVITNCGQDSDCSVLCSSV